jgi:hypothetical protein
VKRLYRKCQVDFDSRLKPVYPAHALYLPPHYRFINTIKRRHRSRFTYSLRSTSRPYLTHHPPLLVKKYELTRKPLTLLLVLSPFHHLFTEEQNNPTHVSITFVSGHLRDFLFKE